MTIGIFGWIIMIISVIFVIGSVLCMVMVCLSLKKYSLKSNVRKLKRTFWYAFIVCAIFIMIIVFCAMSLYNYSAYSGTSSDTSKDNEEYLAVLDKLPFHNEIYNEEQDIWEHLTCVELLYDKYLKLAEEATNFDALRASYLKEFYVLCKLPAMDMDDLLEHVNQFYGSAILPFTDKSLEEVEKDILPIDERMNTDDEVLRNEFWLRASKCSAESSDDSLYQAGRAADDVFKVLINNNQGSFKEAVFYGSMAVGFYLVSVKNNEGNIDLSLIYYKVAEIYIYFEQYVDLGEDDAIHMHYLLMAEMFLRLAEKEYEKTGVAGDINEKLTYFGHYYEDILLRQSAYR